MPHALSVGVSHERTSLNMNARVESMPGMSLSAELARSLRASILETIFDQLSDAVFLYDKDLQVVGVNRAAERLFGMESEEILGKNCRDLFESGSWNAGLGMQPGASSTAGLASGGVSLHMKNGRRRMVIVRTVQVRDNANVV